MAESSVSPSFKRLPQELSVPTELGKVLECGGVLGQAELQTFATKVVCFIGRPVHQSAHCVNHFFDRGLGRQRCVFWHLFDEIDG